MFQRDSILRLVQQFAKSLGVIATLKKARRLDEADEAIARTAKNLIGLDVDTLRALPLEHLIPLFRPGGSLDIGKSLVAGDILREQAAVASLREDDREAARSSLAALTLYLEVFGEGDPERIPERASYAAKTDELIEALGDYELGAGLRRKLFRYLEVQGRYADAEDLLFDLLESGEEPLVAEGVAFYQRLLSRKDEELEAGNLPRSEVREGLASLRSKLV